MINALVLLAVGCGEPEKSGQADTQTISTSEDTAQSTDDQPADLDGDGYGNFLSTQIACLQPSGYVVLPTDCNDADPLINPSVSEECDGFDNDCDNQIDDADPDLDLSTAFTF